MRPAARWCVYDLARSELALALVDVWASCKAMVLTSMDGLGSRCTFALKVASAREAVISFFQHLGVVFLSQPAAGAAASPL